MGEEWLQDTRLGVVVPEASNVTLADALSQEQGNSIDSGSLLPFIKQRSLLFFDERLKVYVVLELPSSYVDDLKLFTSQLELRIEARATNGQADETDRAKIEEQSSNGKDVVFSQTLPATEDPSLITTKPETALAVWEVEVVLNRPRIRLFTPTIVFTAIGSLKPRKDSISEPIEVDLPSFQRPHFNVLDVFKGDPAMTRQHPYLSSETLSRIMPNPGHSKPPIYIPAHQSAAIRIIPAVSARVRYSRMNNYTRRPQTIASLDFEVTPFVAFPVLLDVADVSISAGGSIEPIGHTDLPITCRPRDGVTLLYTLIPSENPNEVGAGTGPVATLDICFAARLLVSSSCIPRITMQWRTNVDFTVPLNPSYGAPSQILQRTNRPTNLPALNTNTGNIANTVTSGLGMVTTTSPDTMLAISFSGLPGTVDLGCVFSWRILVVNHSSRARKLALIAITSRPARRPQSNATAKDTAHVVHNMRPAGGHQSTASVDRNVINTIQQPDLAPAVIDENVLYAMQRSSLANHASASTPLICLSPDVRIGPLGPGAAHECEMAFIALRSGWVRLEGIRVMDVGVMEQVSISSGTVPASLDSGNAVEWFIRDLPDIWVADKRPRASRGLQQEEVAEEGS